MKREVKRIKKVRTNITLDEDLFLESGKYILNLSAFFNKCLKNQLEKERAKIEAEKVVVSDNIPLCKKSTNKKILALMKEQELDTTNQWWED